MKETLQSGDSETMTDEYLMVDLIANKIAQMKVETNTVITQTDDDTNKVENQLSATLPRQHLFIPGDLKS